MVALLHGFSALTLNQAAAATFLFRGVLYLAPAIYGLLSYLALWVPMAATGGEDIFAQEYYADGYSGRVATFEFDTSKGVFAEPQNHYALGFYKF
jgi:hypothetical protein